MKISASSWLIHQVSPERFVQETITRHLISKTLPEFACAAQQLAKEQPLLSLMTEVNIPTALSAAATPSFTAILLRLKEGREILNYMESTSSGATPGPKSFSALARHSLRSELLIDLIFGELLLFFLYLYHYHTQNTCDVELSLSLLSVVTTQQPRLAEIHAEAARLIRGLAWHRSDAATAVSYTDNKTELLTGILDSLVQCIAQLKRDIWNDTAIFSTLKSVLQSAAPVTPNLDLLIRNDRAERTTTASGEEMTELNSEFICWPVKLLTLGPRAFWEHSSTFGEHLPGGASMMKPSVPATVKIIVRNEKHMCWSLSLPNWLCTESVGPVTIQSADCGMMNFLINRDFHKTTENRKSSNNQKPSLYCLRGLELESPNFAQSELRPEGVTVPPVNKAKSVALTMADNVEDEHLLYFKALERLVEVDSESICCLASAEFQRFLPRGTSIARRRNNSFEQFMNFWCVYFALDLEGMTRICSEHNLFGVSNFTEVSIDYLRQIEAEVRLYRVLNSQRQTCITAKPFLPSPRHGSSAQTPPSSGLTIEQEIANFAHHAIAPMSSYLPRLSAQIGCFLYKGMMCARNISIHTDQYDSFKNKFHGQPDVVYSFLKTKISLKPSQILLIRTKEFQSCLAFLATLFLKPTSLSLHLWLRCPIAASTNVRGSAQEDVAGPSAFFDGIPMSSNPMSGTQKFHLNVFLQHLVYKGFDEELFLVICKCLWLYQIPDQGELAEIRHLICGLKRHSTQLLHGVIDFMVEMKFKEVCIISYLIYEKSRITPPHSANPRLPASAVVLNLFINYVRKYGRIGSRRIQLDKINRLINAILIQLKSTQNKGSFDATMIITSQTFHENVISACAEALKEYIIPHLDMIHAAAGFCEIKKSILALEQDLATNNGESSDALPEIETQELIRLVRSVDLDNLKDLGDKVYQVAKVGSSYELLRQAVIFMARKIDARLATALQSFISSITLIPAVYTQMLTALILQYINKLEERPPEAPTRPEGRTGKRRNIEPAEHATDGESPAIKEGLQKLNGFFTQILTTQLSVEEKNSSFVTEGLKTIKSIVLDSIESCRHIQRVKRQTRAALAQFFDIIDTQLLIDVCIENGYKQRAIMLCEEFLSYNYKHVSYYTQFPAVYYKTFRTNKLPDVNIYATENEEIIRIWETCTYLVGSDHYEEERWQTEVANYCDSIAERLKIVTDPRNHTAEIYEAEAGRLTQLCGMLCAEDVLRLNDWSGITCIWDTVLLLPQKYLCQSAKPPAQLATDNIWKQQQPFSLLALPQTGLELSEHNPFIGKPDSHTPCAICELCKTCDCLCTTPRLSTYPSQSGALAPQRSLLSKAKGQLGLINALGILGQSAAISEPLEPLRLELLKGKFNSHTLVHQWVSAFEQREEKPQLLDGLVRRMCQTFDELVGVTDADEVDTRAQLLRVEDVANETTFLEVARVALNLRKPPEKVDNVDNHYHETTEIISCFPNHVHYRLQFAHQLFDMIYEELYDRTVAERSGCKKPLDLMDQPLNSITRMSLGDMILRCMEEYLVCATLDDEVSMTCILRWLSLLCCIPSSSGTTTTQVIDGLAAAKKEVATRFSAAHIGLIAEVPVRVWFRVLPQLVCRSTLLVVGSSVFVPLIARLLIILPHQTLWYLAQLWASTRAHFRSASELILASAHRLQTSSSDPLEVALCKKINPASAGTKTADIKTMWIAMKKWTELLTLAAEDTRIPPGECALKSIYPALATYRLDGILMPIKRTLWVNQQVRAPTVLQTWKEKYAKLHCTSLCGLFQSPSRVISGLSLPVVYLESQDIPTSVIWMRGMNNRVVVYRSKQRPKRVCSLGCDGNLYYFLLKFEGTGDLRKDARVEEIVNSTNENLPPTISTRSITFLVLCLKELSGIIEWICGVSVLKDCLKDPQPSSGKVPECDQRLRFTTRPKQSDYGTILKNYVELGLMKYPPTLHRWFLSSFGDSSSHWLTARTHYIQSLAIWNSIGYVMGLGDRHSENILLSSLTGHITHVDFDCLFDKGQVKLTIPEIVPFRMTPNIVVACGSSYNMLRKNMIDVINVSLKKRSVDFQAILHTFVSDPAVEWNTKTDIQLLNHVQWKIQGKLNHSCHFTKLARQNPKADRYRLATKVPRPETLPVWSHRRLPPEVFVDLLLECSQDKLNLALMYFGWSPWL